MKKLVFALGMIACFFTAQAQTEQGGWLVGANSNLSFTSTSADGIDDNQSNFNLSVQGGYFLADNLAAGLRLGFFSSKLGDNKSTSTSIGPFARYYVNGEFFFGASFVAVSSKLDNGVDDFTTNFTQLAFEAGYPIWIVDNVAIEPSLIYGINSGDDIINTRTFGVNIGFALYF